MSEPTKKPLDKKLVKPEPSKTGLHRIGSLKPEPPKPAPKVPIPPARPMVPPKSALTQPAGAKPGVAGKPAVPAPAPAKPAPEARPMVPPKSSLTQAPPAAKPGTAKPVAPVKPAAPAPAPAKPMAPLPARPGAVPARPAAVPAKPGAAPAAKPGAPHAARPAAVPHPPVPKPAPAPGAPHKPAAPAPAPARPAAPPVRPAAPVRPPAAAPKPAAAPAPHKPAVPPPPVKPTPPPGPPKPRVKIQLREGWRLRDAAEAMKTRPKDLLEKLAAKGVAADLDEFVDDEVAAAVTKATHYDAEFITLDQAMRQRAEAGADDLVLRSPVVTIMGHVDHGKTTLLDAIRSSNLVDRESGGITQHIGAYRVNVKNRSITFIDTPGHEAFTQLRSRGAKATDIVVLVVAADDGIMPQTKEAIDHARAANVPIIVAINKTDKPEANVDRVKQQLAKENLLTEDWGGKTISVEISAREKKNIGDLLEMILLLSDIQEIKANPKVAAQGVVLEARLDSQKGPIATVIVQQGTLTAGQAFVSGLTMGKVRAMFDEHGKVLKSAGPSNPVEIMGFTEVPVAGDPFQVMESAEAARQVVDFRKSRAKGKETVRPEGVTLDELFKKIEGGQAKELNLVVKADVQGSVEVLADVLPPLGTEKVKIKIVHAATGNITEADVILASASKAIVIGYNVKPAPKAVDLANKEGVEIRTYAIIYQLTDDIKKAVIGLLEPVIRESFQGRAEVRKVFQIPRIGTIAGCYVQDGRIVRNAEARVLRGREVIHQGRITSLKHLKENVTEVKKDYECGIGVGGFGDFQPGDTIETFVREKIQAA
ncbi:MAG TPA: translation initiation factor IF-2 [Acidobacteriota bacterium]|nr:translation initiation factor IF-2 [Acidobacteriota bacterium]